MLQNGSDTGTISDLLELIYWNSGRGRGQRRGAVGPPAVGVARLAGAAAQILGRAVVALARFCIALSSRKHAHRLSIGFVGDNVAVLVVRSDAVAAVRVRVS